MPIEGKCETCGSPTVDYECVSCIKLDRRGFQRMARNMFAGLDPGGWRSKMEAGNYVRAAGNAECKGCGMLYLEHPQLPDLPTFHLLCTFEIVKI